MTQPKIMYSQADAVLDLHAGGDPVPAQAGPSFVSQSHQAGALSQPYPRKTILIVDDEKMFREYLAEVLRLEDLEVVTAGNGLEALEIFSRTAVDTVLLDINMPMMNGWDAFRRLISVCPLLPIIIITARPNQEALAEDIGADALMEKPLELPDLITLVQGFVHEGEEARFNRLGKAVSRFRHIRAETQRRSESALNE